MIKNIIFDFDGVLVDSEILVAKAFAKYMQNFDIHIDEKEFASLAGKKTVQIIDILSKKYSIPIYFPKTFSLKGILPSFISLASRFLLRQIFIV